MIRQTAAASAILALLNVTATAQVGPPGRAATVSAPSSAEAAAAPAPFSSGDPCASQRDWVAAERNYPGILLDMAREAQRACESRDPAPIASRAR